MRLFGIRPEELVVIVGLGQGLGLYRDRIFTGDGRLLRRGRCCGNGRDQRGHGVEWLWKELESNDLDISQHEKNRSSSGQIERAVVV